MNTIKFIPLLIGSLLLSCSNNADEPQIPKVDSAVDAKMQWAIDLANSEAERLFPPQSRDDVRTASVSGFKAICDKMSRGENDTLIYVVNYENNKGFALISATGNEQPVLAVVPEGSYDPEIGTDNPGFNLFLDAVTYNANNDTTNNYGFEPVPDYGETIDGKYVKTEKTVIAHFGPVTRIKSLHRWGERDIFGAYCSNKHAGCIPLTITSIIAHLNACNRAITRMNYDYPGADVSYEDINWFELMRHQSSQAIYDDGTLIEHICWADNKDAVHRSLGRICRQIGHDGQAVYNYNNTKVSGWRAPILLKKYLPDFVVSEFASFDPYRTMRCIDWGVMYMRGFQKSDENIEHAWFTDGYEFTRTKVCKYEADKPDPGMQPGWKLVSEHEVDKSLNYMRWGWYGEYDGWYSGKELDPSQSDNPFINMQYVSVTIPKD